MSMWFDGIVKICDLLRPDTTDWTSNSTNRWSVSGWPGDESHWEVNLFSQQEPLILLMAEIRRSPVEVGSLSHYLQGFSTIPGGCLGFQPSTVSVPQGQKC